MLELCVDTLRYIRSWKLLPGIQPSNDLTLISDSLKRKDYLFMLGLLRSSKLEIDAGSVIDT